MNTSSTLQALEALAGNLGWCWDPDAPGLFEGLDADAWASHGHDPLALLASLSDDRRAELDGDSRLRERAEAILARVGPGTRDGDEPVEALDAEHPVVYMCAEFGIHESVRIYSGGLGILAGDHLKSASDLGIPLVAVGLFYRGGFFTQTVSAEGTQVVGETPNDPARLPVHEVVDGDGAPLRVSVALPDRTIHVGAWEATVGRVRLLLLDTDVDGNTDDDKAITRTLYKSSPRWRILQEVVLGMGGAEVVRAVGLEPRVFHLNEGHAAFCVLARTARAVEAGKDLAAARAAVQASTVFTTHTPVPAGHDRFDLDLFREHFSHAQNWLGMSFDDLVALGQGEGESEQFNMTYLALRFSGWVNGVSQLHAEVSRELLQPAYPGVAVEDVPIEGITNGVHLPTWVGGAMCRRLGVEGRRVKGSDFVEAAARLSDAELWAHRNEGRAGLVAAVKARGLPEMNPDALTIGFARRFATYKRAGMLIRDLDRLAAIVGNADRPVQILIAGKAHPADVPGQGLMRAIVDRSRSEAFLGKLVFVPNYEIDVARMLLEGVDVWLNTPTRGKEASGTSGMKAAANGALNLSISDGWWVEGDRGDNGWTLGKAGRTHAEQEAQDAQDAEDLYGLIENSLVPDFYDRTDGVPTRWTARMRASLASIPVVYDTDRMVREYLRRGYEPLAKSQIEG